MKNQTADDALHYDAGDIASLLDESIKNGLELEVVEETESTNNDLKSRAAAEGVSLVVRIARSQSGGRGRRGHSFFSPTSGIYMSVLLPCDISSSDVGLMTAATSVAVARAIKKTCGIETRIKWVNDLQLENGKKICGILAEGVSFRGERLTGAVIGIGINVAHPSDGFPADIADIAGAIFERADEATKTRLAAAVINELLPILSALPQNTEFIDEYRSRSSVIGRRVRVLAGDSTREAEAIAIDDGCKLLVRYDDGTEQALFSGDVSVRTV